MRPTWIEVHLERVAERVDDRLGLALSQEPVVDEHARELVADGAVDQHGDHRRVDAARQRAQHALALHLRADGFDRRCR